MFLFYLLYRPALRTFKNDLAILDLVIRFFIMENTLESYIVFSAILELQILVLEESIAKLED